MTQDIFREKVVIITGASAGIGRSLSLKLAEQGAHLAIAARRADRLEQVAAECRLRGGKVITIPTDVTDETQCKALVEKTIGEYRRLDMLINNAGLAASALLEDFPDLNLFKHTMDVNFYGTLYCTYYALPHLKMSQGRLVGVSSLGGKIALPYNTPYASSKYALHGLFDALRIELAPAKVSVTAICPYWVVTEFHESQMDKDGKPRGPQGRAYYTDKMMTADQCAEITLKAAAKRKREVLMGPGPLAVWLKLIAPALLDTLTIKTFLEPAAKRAKAAREANK